MTVTPRLLTDRLTLRRWRDSDRLPFARLNCDPAVMEFYPTPFSDEESNQTIDRAEAHFNQHGFGPWAVELRETAEFIGYIGLANLRSRRVMEKLGMTHDPRDDFDHPLLPEGHRLRHHVLYRLASPPLP
jgi:RimJ/RimL family protein N-acetyltransferase